ncbi:MAG: Ig-like domain-containing protein [Planctomycetota bacterium]
MACALVGAACGGGRRTPPPFEIVRTSPSLADASEPVLLNDSITLYFSDAIHPLSVTSDSVTLVDGNGHQVPGTLRVGSNWVTFVPDPPLSPTLTDGSFQPGATYRLFVAGYPRHDAVRAADGRRLAAAAAFEVHVASLDQRPLGLPAPLRPTSIDMPFLLRRSEAPQSLPADAPRLRLHFTLPVLPTSVAVESFEILLLSNIKEALIPRSVRVVTSRFDEIPGSSVEIDLGVPPQRRHVDGPSPLQPGDYISVGLRKDARAVTDYAGNRDLRADPQVWSVVAGSAVALMDWPSDETCLPAEDPILPCFEVMSGRIRPRVRTEAGDGCLGVFRPKRNTVLRPGEPFDRGDGQRVVSQAGVFPFLAVDSPPDVVVVVDATGGPVQLLACGDIRLAGVLELRGPSVPLQLRRYETETAAVRHLVEAAPVVLLAAGDIHVRGVVRTEAPHAAEGTVLTLASASRIHLDGQLPHDTILAFESAAMGAVEPAILGPRGQTHAVPATFTYGLARGAAFTISGLTTWRQLPATHDGGVVRLLDADPALRVGWQSAPADPVRKNEPDLGLGRVGRMQRIADQGSIAPGSGAYVRFTLEAIVDSQQPPPELGGLRLLDR